MYILNDDTQNYPLYSIRLQLVAETFVHEKKLTNQSKFNNSPQGC